MNNEFYWGDTVLYLPDKLVGKIIDYEPNTALTFPRRQVCIPYFENGNLKIKTIFAEYDELRKVLQ